MRLVSYYKFTTAGFQFRLYKRRSGHWLARVYSKSYGRWHTVIYPTGTPVHNRTKKTMQEYLRYAYGGKTEVV